MEKKKRVEKGIIYIVLAIVFAFSIAGANWLDQYLEWNGVMETGIKVVIIIAILAYADWRGELKKIFSCPVSWKMWFLVLFPLLFNIPLLTVFDQSASVGAVIGIIIGVLTTAIWEELFFRYVGQAWFERDGCFTVLDVIFLAAVFALPHMVNIVIHPVLDQVFTAFCFGVFTLALYRHSGSLLLPMVSHILLNTLGQFLALFSSEDALLHPYLGSAAVIISEIAKIAALAIGMYILIRHKYIIRVPKDSSIDIE